MQARLVAMIIQGLQASKRTHLCSTAEDFWLREGEDAVQASIELILTNFGNQSQQFSYP